jgi:hypothetical protein
MKSFQKLKFLAAGFGVAMISAWITSAAQAQQSTKSISVNEGKIRVCVAKDGVIRLGGLVACPPGQTQLDLKIPDYPSTDAPEEKSKNDVKTCAEAKLKVDELDERLRNAEKSPDGKLKNRVTAPFQVFGRDGKIIFSVTEDRTAAIYDASGTRVTQMGASRSGGYISAKSSSQKLDVGMEAGANLAQIVITDSGTERLILGREQVHGTYRLKVMDPQGGLIAGIGQNSEAGGAGVALVTNGFQDGPEATMSLSKEGKGIVGVRNRNRTLAYLTEGLKGGLLSITDANSTLMVEAGVTTGGFGVVRVGPQAFKPGFGVLGLPGSYIAGKP